VTGVENLCTDRRTSWGFRLIRRTPTKFANPPQTYRGGIPLFVQFCGFQPQQTHGMIWQHNARETVMKELRLSVAIAFGVFGGLSMWSWMHPWPAPITAQNAAFQQADYLKPPVDVRVVEVARNFIMDVNIKGNDVRAECGSYRAEPCYVKVAN
jgi:hypothetical protein